MKKYRAKISATTKAGTRPATHVRANVPIAAARPDMADDPDPAARHGTAVNPEMAVSRDTAVNPGTAVMAETAVVREMAAIPGMAVLGEMAYIGETAAVLRKTDSRERAALRAKADIQATPEM